MASEGATFWLEFLPDQGVAVVHAAGRIDLDSARQFESVLLQSSECGDASLDVVVDLQSLTSADTTLLDVLAPWAVHLQQGQRHLRLVGVPVDVQRLIDAFDLADLLPATSAAAPSVQETLRRV